MFRFVEDVLYLFLLSLCENETFIGLRSPPLCDQTKLIIGAATKDAGNVTVSVSSL